MLPDQLGRLDRDAVARLSMGPQDSNLADFVRAVGFDRDDQLTIETVISASDKPLERLIPEGLPTIARFQSDIFESAHIRDDKHGEYLLTCWTTAEAGIYHLVTSIPFTDPRWKRIQRWIGRANPDVTACFLDEPQVGTILTSISDLGEAEVSRLTAKKLSDGSSLARGWRARAVGSRPSPQQAIDLMANESASIRTVAISVRDTLSMHLRRVAGATLYSGNFDLFYHAVLVPLASAASSRRQLLQDRARKTSDRVIRPLQINLPRPIFQTREDTGNLIDELSASSNLNLAVLHRNPYLHLVVTNVIDGSNFDILVTDPSQIAIYPGYRSSIGALTQLSDTVSDRFSGISVSESSRKPTVSLDDLVEAL